MTYVGFLMDSELGSMMIDLISLESMNVHAKTVKDLAHVSCTQA